MKIEKTEIQGCYLIKPTTYKDERGYFIESFNNRIFFNTVGRFVDFIQDNESCSSYGVIRGLHAQTGKFAQAKLVRVVKGKVMDVIIDVRTKSPTFGHVVTRILDDSNKHQLFIPKGCLHGFSVLEDDTIFSYKCDNYYNKSSEISVNPLDLALNINWKIAAQDRLISEKDLNAQSWDTFMQEVLAYRSDTCLIRAIHSDYSINGDRETQEIVDEIYISEGPFISSAQGL